MRSYMVAMVLLFIAIAHPSFAQSSEAPVAAGPAAAAPPPEESAAAAALRDDEGRAEPVAFDVGRYFSLNCTPPDNVDAPVYSWRKNGTALEASGRFAAEEGGAVLRLTARAQEDDYGVYGCLLGGAPARAWRVWARPAARLPPNSNVVEGQQLKLTCKLLGKPYPNVTWTYRAEEEGNATDALERLGARGSVAQSAAGVPRGELVLRDAQREDAGVYECAPERAGVPARSVLRVKDKYAALWPFLGICLEVLVLCAIILVYERRRTKPESDDSDTDNHDQ